MEKNLTVFERTLHKIHITFEQDASVSNFTWSGAAKSMYGCECFHFDTDINGNEVIMTTPSLSTGLYKYQIFCKNRDNVEYLVLSGEINVKDKLCDCDQQPAIDSNESTAEVTVSPEVINVTVILPGSEISGENTITYTFAEDGTYAIEGDLSGVTDGSNMFNNESKLTSFNVDLPALTWGDQMFDGCGKLTSFEGDLSALTDGNMMFNNCMGLTSFNVDLPALTDAERMFQTCMNLTSFSADLSALTNGLNMFNGCNKLTSFSGDLSSLTNGTYMFQGCKSLTSFSGDLSSLTDGTYMFGYSLLPATMAKLDLASVQNIANTINDLAAAGKTGRIEIGIQKSLKTSLQTAPINIALEAIRAKGWTVNDYYN